MSCFGTNIKLLRKRRRRTQDDVANTLGMKRSTLSGYENGVAEPGLDTLTKLSKYFNVSIDTLVKTDLAAMSESQLSQLERGYDVFLTGSKLRVLATTVDRDNEENIEMVSEKAKAGYRSGFADPKFIRVLPVFRLPFLSLQKKYRCFQVSGDSMLPVPDGAWVTCEFMQNWHLIRDGQAYVVHTLDDGVVFKLAENRIREEGRLRLHALNPLYEPYEVNINEVREVWRFVNYISDEMPDPLPPQQELSRMVNLLRKDIEGLKKVNPSSGSAL